MSPFIETITKISPITPAAGAAMQKIVHVIQVPRYHILTREGEKAETAYFITKGAVRAYFLQEEKDITDWFAFENQLICSPVSFFSDLPGTHSLETMEPCTLITIRKQDLHKLCDQFHDIERLTRLIITDTFLQLQQRVVAQRFYTAAQRYEALIQTYPQLIKRVPLRFIASYLGVAQETLSRIRAAN